MSTTNDSGNAFAERLQEIAALLQADGHEASVEYPGCLSVVVDDDAGVTFDVGTANGPWEIDLNDGGAIQQSCPGATLPETASAREVADWVALAVENYREVARGVVTDEERSNGPRK